MSDYIFTKPRKIKMLKYNATLTRDGKVIGLAAVDQHDRILCCSVLSCAYDGTPKFDAWIGQQIPGVKALKDGGLAYKFRTAGKLKEAA